MKTLAFHLLLLICQNSYGQLTAKEVLQKSAASMKMLNSIHYTFYAEQENEKINGELIINRVQPFPVFEIAQVKFVAVSISDEGSLQISFAYDGSALEYIDRSSQKLMRIGQPSISAIMQSGLMNYAMLPLPCYLQASPFEKMIGNLRSATIETDTVINKIECYKCKVVTQSSDFSGPAVHEVYWYIGKEDFLVRGMHSKYLKQFIKIITTNRPFTSEDFMLAPKNISLRKTDGNDPLTAGLLAIGSPAPLWRLLSNKATTISLEELKGKVVLIDFWGTWCVPCIQAMPDIQAVYDHFKGQPVEVIGISVELQKTADPASFVKTKGFTYPIALNGNEVAEKYKVAVFPSIYIIDKNGKIIHAEHSGGRENFKNDVIDRIAKALKERWLVADPK